MGDNVNRMDTGDNLGAGLIDVYSYSVDISPTTLTAGTTYWLSIVNNTPTDSDDDWDWATAAQTGTYSLRTQDGNSWFNPPSELAFRLTDDNITTTTPEPSSLLGFT